MTAVLAFPSTRSISAENGSGTHRLLQRTAALVTGNVLALSDSCGAGSVSAWPAAREGESSSVSVSQSRQRFGLLGLHMFIHLPQQRQILMQFSWPSTTGRTFPGTWKISAQTSSRIQLLLQKATAGVTGFPGKPGEHGSVARQNSFSGQGQEARSAFGPEGWEVDASHVDPGRCLREQTVRELFPAHFTVMTLGTAD